MDYTTDVVVIGAGAAGFGAAITLADAGKHVMLLEKGNKYGGAGMFGAQGLFAVGSRAQKEAGSDFTVKEAYTEMMDYTHYRSDPAITKAILSKSADTIDWLAAHGLRTELVNNTQEVHQGRPKVYHQYIDKFAGFDRLAQGFKDKGGQLLLETYATEITATDGHVSAVKIDGKNGTGTISCQAVIVADGGYIGSKKMVNANLAIDPSNLYSMGERKATGDGIKMLNAIGADTRKLGNFENHAASVVSTKDPKWHNQTIFTLTNLPFLWLNRRGERFVDESICYDFALWGNITYTQGGYYYYVLDQATVDYLRANKLDWTDSFERTFTSLAHTPVTHQVGPFPDLPADLEDAETQGASCHADTLDELAAKLGVSAATVTAAVTDYNAAVKAKDDETFYKPSDYLRFSVEKGPFYAVKAQSTSLGTIGGVATDAHMQVLTTDGKPIPGAYVAGNDANGMYDTSYPTMEGISCAFAWNSGRIAGEAAREQIAK